MHHPTTTRNTVVPLAAVLLLALVACTEPPVEPPSSSPPPAFATDADALAAAEKAYGKYLATADAIFADGGRDAERLRELVSAEVFERELEGFQRVAARRLTGIGTTTFELTFAEHGASIISVYACDDVSQTDLLGPDGQSVVKPERVERIPYVVEFDVADNLRIVRKDVWEQSPVC
ncbi:hypothetical protein [Homoserinibacter sp. GY 40078]|uniref:hypothetical protein n=1 Tax=Homoserinibacter sp. GY 40078 TaxID=2603275 RepID=UPI0021072470|nr:hypothetical protein [Homoserinibacter sp. GY 40078]